MTFEFQTLKSTTNDKDILFLKCFLATDTLLIVLAVTFNLSAYTIAII